MKIQLDSNAINSLFPDGTGARLELQKAVIQNFVKKVRFAQLEQEIADKLGIIDGVMRREIESQIKKEITERFGVDIESSSYFSLASDCSELTGCLTSSIAIYLDDCGITDVTAKTGCTPLLLCASNSENRSSTYCFYKNVIYRFDNYTVEYDDYIKKFNRNYDGSIDFVSMFYNGGTDFYEELQDGLDELLNKENKDED